MLKKWELIRRKNIFLPAFCGSVAYGGRKNNRRQKYEKEIISLIFPRGYDILSHIRSRAAGEIGRHKGLRILRREACGFESRAAHHDKLKNNYAVSYRP